MTKQILVYLFIFFYSILIGADFAAQALSYRRVKKQGRLSYKIFLPIALILSLSWFFIRDFVGTYSGNVFSESLGVTLMLAGTIGYLATFFVLQHNWSLSAKIKEGHTLVTVGPYRFVRHPMYFFMMLVIIGSGLAISNYMILIFSVLPGFAYYLRAKEEEGMLMKEFPEYTTYAKKVKMVIPGVV